MFTKYLESLSDEGKAKLNILDNTSTEQRKQNYSAPFDWDKVFKKEWGAFLFKESKKAMEQIRKNSIDKNKELRILALKNGDFYCMDSDIGLHTILIFSLMYGKKIYPQEDLIQDWEKISNNETPFLCLFGKEINGKYIVCISESYDKKVISFYKGFQKAINNIESKGAIFIPFKWRSVELNKKLRELKNENK